MEHQDFIVGYRYMREANISQAMVYFCFKSEEWIKENIPQVVYDEPIYKFIKSYSVCIHITKDTAIYEVNGLWQRITKKDSIQHD